MRHVGLRASSAWASVIVAHGPGCPMGLAASGMWNILRPGIEPVPPALLGRFLSAAPTREVLIYLLNLSIGFVTIVNGHHPHPPFFFLGAYG